MQPRQGLAPRAYRLCFTLEQHPLFARPSAGAVFIHATCNATFSLQQLRVEHSNSKG